MFLNAAFKSFIEIIPSFETSNVLKISSIFLSVKNGSTSTVAARKSFKFIFNIVF